MNAERHDDLERLHDDLAGFALGALDPDESRSFELHLEDCGSCRERLQWLYPAVDLLPASVEQISPPESLRQGLMDTVLAEAEEAAASSPTPQRPAPALEKRSWWSGLSGSMMRPAAGFAVVMLLVAGAATGYLLRGSDSEPAKSTFVKAEPTRGTAPGVSATLERHGDSATLHVNQMPKLARNEVYEVWVQRGGVMEPASIFILGRDGSAKAAVPGPLEGAEGVYVTAEPYPGSARPTSPPLLEAQLQ